jgi:hypothetical protein
MGNGAFFRIMNLFIYISILFLVGCSNSDKNIEEIYDAELSENQVLFLKDNDHFDIYFETDTLSFYLEKVDGKNNEYTYDIYSLKDKIKRGRFIYGVNFEDSDTLELYFKCSSIIHLKELCGQWIYFVKDSNSNLYFKN